MKTHKYAQTPHNFFHIAFWLPPERDVFSRRAERFDELAQENRDWADYLRQCAAICRAQQMVFDRLPERALPQHDTDNTPLNETLLDIYASEIEAMYAEMYRLLQPQLSRTADTVWQELLAQSAQQRRQLAERIVRAQHKITDRDYRVWVHAVLQTVFTRAALTLPENRVRRHTDAAHTGYCPACGSDTVGAVVIGKGENEGLRYLHCPLCNSRHHAVRAQCTFCGNGENLSLHSIENGQGALAGAAAESCPKCHAYRKFYRQDKQQYADPVADDLASLPLDMLLGEKGIQRGGENPFLVTP